MPLIVMFVTAICCLSQYKATIAKEKDCILKQVFNIESMPISIFLFCISDVVLVSTIT